jgi:hypothetical protein
MAGFLEGSIGSTAEKLLREFHQETAQPPVKDLYNLTDLEQWLIIQLHKHETAANITGAQLATANFAIGHTTRNEILAEVQGIAKPYTVQVQEITNGKMIYRRGDNSIPDEYPEFKWVIFKNGKVVFHRSNVEHLLHLPHYLFSGAIEANKFLISLIECNTEK